MANKKTQSEKLEAMFDALGESVCNEGADAILEDLRQESVHPRVRTKQAVLLMHLCGLITRSPRALVSRSIRSVHHTGTYYLFSGGKTKTC